MHPSVRFFNTLQAFQAFAGKPLKVMECATLLSHEELAIMDLALLRMAEHARTLEFSSTSQKDNEEAKLLCTRLADDIEKWIGKTLSEQLMEMQESVRS